MLLLRILGLVVVIAVGASLVAYLLTGQRHYLVLSWRIAKYSLLFALAMLALLAFERLIVIL